VDLVCLVVVVLPGERSTLGASLPFPRSLAMKTHLVHPVSALAGATVILGACLLSGMQQPAGEKQDILRHMTIVYLPDGQGGTAKTIRFTGVNVQVVNGVGSTNTVNGTGNLIVGYNELGNPKGDDRTGSHNIVGGRRNTSSSWGGIVVGQENAATGQFASVTGGRRNTASGYGSSVSGGYNRSVSGTHDWRAGSLFEDY